MNDFRKSINERVDLVAVLSNTQTEVLYQRLTARDWRQVPWAVPRRRDRSRDGKLKFGTVSSAVLAVLAEADGPMRFIEIHGRVEELLGISVSKGTVKEFLSAEAREGRSRFRRLGRGLYHMPRG
jgi:hypothetical protein